ncbi:MAG: hypothetical protein PHF52_08665 [Sulfurospirillaceae bacterium]|nr:hypothetical protein [Sulfurospirillaceae bacterium]
MREDVFEEIKKYTKDEILEGLKKTMFRPESLLRELPITRYNSMCGKAMEIAKQASNALKSDNIKLFIELNNKSDKMWREANDFIDKHNENWHKQLLEFGKEK